ncbi:muscarinic acetylcholine receptor M2-like [Scyliorhinus canicula]|uniref:muscarinic acetylcholine receptor M2-like n=1 Tax=Scyliorhinus canicula TaxID=7830 RepID=UPI0018F56D2E|nr:muscarinic acetylcholine receptor M2-like [Scyliorhinus canicula]
MEDLSKPNESLNNLTGLNYIEKGSSYKTVDVIFIVTVTGSLSFVTIIGNILVIASIKVNRHLQTINNYFIFSLACADLIIGVFSMNLYTTYIVFGYWPLGPVVCDLWLALDYVVCNASSMNLLVISFDRYFCVTKPLSYPVKRTAKMAGMMIAAAWVLSFILFVPVILFWQFIVGFRAVAEGECYAPFFSNPAVTFATAIAGFYLPVIIMVILYVQISRASKSRVKKDKKETELSKYTVTYCPAKDKIRKQSTSNIIDVPNVFAHYKMQDSKITGAITIDNRGQRVEKELSNESASRSERPTNHKDKEMFPDSTAASSTQQIVSKSQTSDGCGTTAGIVSGFSSNNENDRAIRAGKKIVTMPNTPAKKKRGDVSREDKVTRTVLAILLAVIITWSPYFIMVLINTFCSTCVPNPLWTFGFWLAYINSTVNPACYALCNPTFKKTFKHLLLCQYRNGGVTG